MAPCELASHLLLVFWMLNCNATRKSLEVPYYSALFKLCIKINSSPSTEWKTNNNVFTPVPHWYMIKHTYKKPLDIIRIKCYFPFCKFPASYSIKEENSLCVTDQSTFSGQTIIIIKIEALENWIPFSRKNKDFLKTIVLIKYLYGPLEIKTKNEDF